MESVQYDALWSGAWGDLQRYGPVSRHNRRIVRELVSDTGARSILDAGCGEGSLLAFLASSLPGANRLAGVDVSEAALARARRIVPNATFAVADLSAGPIPGDRYELVTSVDVIEHVPDDAAFLRGLAASSSRWVLVGTIQGRMRPGERDIGHLRNYARGELVAKMRAAGIEPRRVVEWGFPFYSPLFRSAVSVGHAEPLSMGAYGPGRKLLCSMLYGLFSLNSSRRGDRVYVLGSVAP